jgi:hypothetical protein
MKQSIREIAQLSLPSRFAPVVVASMGRSGSTLIHDAICQGLAAARFRSTSRLAARLVAGYAWDLGATQFRPGVVYKTHALAEELRGRPDVKVVFLFGSAVDAAVSVLNARKNYGDDWIAAHFQNLRAQGDLNTLADRDVLRFADQLDGWTSHASNPVIALKYDALWDNQDRLSAFLGYDVTLPERRARSEKVVDAEVIDRLNETYATLEARIEAMPGVIISGSCALA